MMHEPHWWTRQPRFSRYVVQEITVYACLVMHLQPASGQSVHRMELHLHSHAALATIIACCDSTFVSGKQHLLCCQRCSFEMSLLIFAFVTVRKREKEALIV